MHNYTKHVQGSSSHENARRHARRRRRMATRSLLVLVLSVLIALGAIPPLGVYAGENGSGLVVDEENATFDSPAGSGSDTGASSGATGDSAGSGSAGDASDTASGGASGSSPAQRSGSSASAGDFGTLSDAYAIDPTKVLGNSVDYIAAKFENVGTNSVFDLLTYERLQKGVLQREGKSIILLASPRNGSSQATLAYINEVAKANSVEKIYLFDPHLGGELGYDGTDITNPDAHASIYALWTALKTTAGSGATATAQLKYIDAAYTGDDTYLFIYDRTSGADAADTIVDDLLVTDGAIATADVNAFKSKVADLFAALGSSQETRYSQYDFFTTAYSAANPKVNAYSANPTDFKLAAVTSPQLIHLLKTTGTHNVLVSGSWCPDSRAAVGYISENATRFNSAPVYVWDFRANGATSAVTYLASDTAGNKALAGWLGAEVIRLLGDYTAGHENTVGRNFVDGNPAASIVDRTNINFRSPFLVQVSKQADQPLSITRNWIHYLAAYERPWHYNETHTTDGAIGFAVDYELSSGYLTNAQKALGRVAIGDFFKGSKITYTPSSNVSTTVNKDDNGCGDDNDPLNNNPDEDMLIPYHGTTDYNVTHYDIKIDYYPEYLADADLDNDDEAIGGVTTIQAIASKALNTIALDFRALAVDNSGVKLTVNGNDTQIAQIIRENEDEVDNNKINIVVSGSIPKDAEFTVTIPYTTGIIDNFVADGSSPQGFFTRNDGKGIAALGEPLGSTYWFPNNNTPYDGASYTITLIAPSGYTKVSNGVRTSNQTSGTRRATVWNVSQDTAPYQIFAYISNDVTELAGTSNANYPLASQAVQQVSVSDGDGGFKVISGLSYVNKTIYDANDNRNRDRVDRFYSKLPWYIQELEKIAGPYPGESAGFVFENLGNGLGESAGWGAVETKDRPFFASTGITGEGTFVHEYAHQWYGNAVRIAGWEDLWLNEGFATYVTDLFYESTQGFDVQAKWKRVYDNTSASREWWQYAPASIANESDLFGGASSAYNRGALALAALRTSVGDEDFFSILKDWVAAYKGQAASTADFIAFAEDTANVDLTNWADAWLYGEAKPAAWPVLIPDDADTLTAAAIITGPAEINEGETALYEIAVAEVGKAGNLAIDIAFSGNLSYVSAAAVFSELDILGVLDNPDGSKRIVLWAAAPGATVDASEPVVRIAFKATAEGEGRVTLKAAFGASYIQDAQGNVTDTKDFEVLVPAGDAATIVTEIARSYDAFDFNRDGQVTLSDLTFAQGYYRASAETSGAVWAVVIERGIDVNDDGIVDVADFILILTEIHSR